MSPSWHHICVVIHLLHSNLVTPVYLTPLTRPRGRELPPKVEKSWHARTNPYISCRFLPTRGRGDRKSVKRKPMTGLCVPCPRRNAILKLIVFVRWKIMKCGRVSRNVFNESGTTNRCQPESSLDPASTPSRDPKFRYILGILSFF